MGFNTKLASQSIFCIPKNKILCHGAKIIQLIGCVMIGNTLDLEKYVLFQLLYTILLCSVDLWSPSTALKIYALFDLEEYECYRNTWFTKFQLTDLMPRLQLSHIFQVQYNRTYLTIPSEFGFIVFWICIPLGESYHTIQIKFGNSK